MTELSDDFIVAALNDFLLVQVGAPDDVYASIGEAMAAATRKPYPPTLTVLCNGLGTISSEQQDRVWAKVRARREAQPPQAARLMPQAAS